MGNFGDFNAALILKSGDLLHIHNNATLRIRRNSRIVIGSGARLIIDGGSIINFTDLESHISIESGGELIINGQFNFSGNGHFRFEQGNIFTLNSNLALTGAGRNNPLIKIIGQANITVLNPFELSVNNASIIHETGFTNPYYIFLKNGATFRANNTLFDDQQVIPFGSRTASFIKVDEPIDVNNDPDDVDYSFENCIFQNTGIAVDLDVPYAQNSGSFDWRNLNLQFTNSTFTNCQALKADRSFITIFDGCTLNNSNIDIAHTYWLNVRQTTIRSNLLGPGDQNFITSSYYGIKTAHVGHFWFRENSLIDAFGTGIDASEGLNWNIIMTDQSTIQRCATAINTNGSVFNSTVDLGLLHMDCARLIQNGAGIRGEDIIFSAYARNGTANVFTRNINNPTGLFIESLFRNRQDTELWFHGNFWDGTTPTAANNAWLFRTRFNFPQPAIPWTGTIHIDPVSAVANCGGIALRGEKEDPLGKKTIVKINGVLYDVKKQYEAALRILKKDKFKDAIRLFKPVSDIPRNIRDTASSTVKHFVDMARTFTLSTAVSPRSASSDGWLPEAIVGIAKEDNTLVLSPNPANELFDITLPQGDYNMQVFDALGKLIFNKDTDGGTSVDVRTWQNGIYLVNLLDKTTKVKQHSKVVVQH
jgi:hypothetical protein